MTNGSAKLTLADLDGGDHTAVVTFMGNDLYNNKTVTKQFTTDERIKINVTGTGNETLVNVTFLEITPMVLLKLLLTI